MDAFWTKPVDEVLAAVRADPGGLTTAEAEARRPPPSRDVHVPALWQTLAAQFLNPLVLLLVVAGGVSVAVGDVQDALILLGIVLVTGGFGFARERSAHREVARLLASVHLQARVRRDGRVVQLPHEALAPGDVVLLSVGATVPGDARVLAADGLHVDEAPLTGESFPVVKGVAPTAADVAPGARSAAVFRGTHVVSGTGEAVLVAVGDATELGRVGHELQGRRPPTDFDQGLRRFGNLLVGVSAALVLAIFAVNVAFERPVLESFLFSIAIAVGLVPEMLPAIVTVNLARGASRMAAAEVVVKRLTAIEDFGAVDVVCADKTGTLTVGEVRLHAALGLDGAPSDRVLELAWLNATFESGYANPIDEALRAAHPGDPGRWRRAGEVPYDFVRKRLGVVVDGPPGRLLVVKGQVEAVLSACTTAERAGAAAPLAVALDDVRALHERLASEGLRTLAVAVRTLDPSERIDRGLERDLTLIGLVALADPAEPDARAALHELAALGVRLKVLTGDDRRVARRVWRELLDRDPVLLTGADLAACSTAALEQQAPGVDVFAELEPVQKERVVQALRRRGAVVAFLGDGINDAPALRHADVGVSVVDAVDVAKEAADLVLRRHDLSVIAEGLREGRRTMTNTLKYVHYTTSANFGNMVSMAAASLFLPFLPLLPKQILLNNLLSDLPAMTLAGDTVDDEEIARPRRWDTSRIRSFMLVFGSVSSIFDLLTFGLLLLLFREHEEAFRSGWFVASLLTEVLVLLVLRSPRPFGASVPSRTMRAAVVGTSLLAVALPYTGPVASMFGLVPLPAPVMAAVVGTALAYVVTTEVTKRWFQRWPGSAAR